MDDAEAAYRAILQLDPQHAQTLFLLGTLHLQRSDLPSAIRCFEASLERAPPQPEAHSHYGLALAGLGRHEEALKQFDTAIALKPHLAAAHGNRGMLLFYRSDWDESLKSYDRAISLHPDYSPYHEYRSTVLRELGRFEEAIGSLEQAIHLDPTLLETYPKAHYQTGMWQLTLGNFEDGWTNFERRPDAEKTPVSKLRFKAPQWDGVQSLVGKTILLHAEGGYGDTIQFCRYVPMVAAKGARVILEVQPSLVALLSQLPGVDTIVASDTSVPAADFHCSLLSLPWAFRTRLATIPASIPYLTAKRIRVKSWERRLADLHGRKIGLVWAGAPEYSEDRRRSIPLQAFAPLAMVEGVHFVSLQTNVPANPSAALAPGFELSDFTADIHDWTDTAALVACLDLVISVDTAVAHLAGAMGRPVFLLNRFVPCWRWLLHRKDSPWYPSLTQFRQPRFGDWTSVIQDVCHALRQGADPG